MKIFDFLIFLVYFKIKVLWLIRKNLKTFFFPTNYNATQEHIIIIFFNICFKATLLYTGFHFTKGLITLPFAARLKK